VRPSCAAIKGTQRVRRRAVNKVPFMTAPSDGSYLDWSFEIR
jgi:hypothetical protein